MTARATSAPGPLSLDAEQQDLLSDRIRRAGERARKARAPRVATVSVPVHGVDPASAVFGARSSSDPWFCFEQPDREFALATLGEAARIDAAGPARFGELARRCRDLARDAETSPDADPPVFVGGLAFAAQGAAAPEWSGFGSARLSLPELALVRRGDAIWMTLAAVAHGDEDPDAVAGRLAERAASLGDSGLPLIDPDPVQAARVAGAAPPEHYEAAVARAVELIRRGDVEKIVLAREVRVHAGSPIDAGAVFGALREVFPSCYCFCAGTPDGAFVGASPELLVRREGFRAQTVALAGTTRRSADPAIDDHLGEQLRQSDKEREEHEIVASRIQRTLRPVSVWVAAADDPALVKVQNVQHLATPIRAQLRNPVPAIELAGRLHPTPAVGGEPCEEAVRLIPALEGLDRGWYAGPLGWTDFSDDGEFCVALRSALLRDRTAHLYAGCGIVRDSDPAAELAETEIKLQALLPLLA